MTPSLPAWWPHLATSAALLIALLWARRWPGAFALLTWCGVAAHELSHALVGLLLAARPVRISVIPRTTADGTRELGHVVFARLVWWNALPVSLAPLLLLAPAAAALYWRAAQSAPLSWGALALQLLAAQLLLRCWPSRRDWRHAFGGAAVLASLAIVAFLLWRRFAGGA